MRGNAKIAMAQITSELAKSSSGLSIKQLAENLDAQYHTVYRHVQQMAAENQIRKSGFAKDRSDVYLLTDRSAGPMFEINGKYHKARVVAMQLAADDFSNTSFAIQELVAAWANIYVGKNIAMDDKFPANTRGALIGLRNRLGNVVDIITQMLNEDILWEDKLREEYLLNDPDLPDDYQRLFIERAGNANSFIERQKASVDDTESITSS